MYSNSSEHLLDFINRSPSCFHLIKNITELSDRFIKLNENESWQLDCGKCYYTVRSDSSVIVFRIPTKKYKSFRIAAAHSDSPSFKIKSSPVIKAEGHYTKLNVEKYGSMIMSSWLDRPLGAAGRVVVRENDCYKSILTDIDRDIFIIPNIAIHMNRKINDGYCYNPQTDMLPLFGDEKADFMWLLSDCCGIKTNDILGYDLFLYNRQKGFVWGADNEFISSRSLDDLQCVFAIAKGFLASSAEDSVSVFACFDNEETGSLSKQGADSSFLKDVIDRINECFGLSVNDSIGVLSDSFMISADNAHAVHPNHPELADPTNRPYLNGGIVIKYNAAQKYTTDAFSEAVVKSLCKRADIPYQYYANRSDIAGGSTLGSIANRHVSVRTADIGLGQLAMHSCFETAGSADTEYLIEFIKTFYNTDKL